MQLQLQPVLNVSYRRCDRCQNIVMAPQALKSSQSHAGILPPLPALADSRYLLDVVIAFCQFIANQGLDNLQR